MQISGDVKEKQTNTINGQILTELGSGRLCVQNMRLITDNQPQEKHIDLSVDHNDIKKKCNTAIKAPET